MAEALKDLLPLAVVLALVMWVVWAGRRRAMRSRESEGALSGSQERRHNLQRAMEELQINVMEFSRDVEGRLETRMRALERLIHDADDRIKRLEELEGKPAPPDAREVPALHGEIYALADQGFDKIEIARQTDTNPGEVELILALRRSRDG